MNVFSKFWFKNIVIFFLRTFCTQNGQNMGVKNFEPILCLVGAHQMRLIFLNSTYTGSQLFNAHSIIKIGQKLASVRRLKICTRAPKMTPLMKNFKRGVKKKYSPNFKISYRSEFLSNFKNKISFRKLRSRRI